MLSCPLNFGETSNGEGIIFNFRADKKKKIHLLPPADEVWLHGRRYSLWEPFNNLTHHLCDPHPNSASHSTNHSGRDKISLQDRRICMDCCWGEGGGLRLLREQNKCKKMQKMKPEQRLEAFSHFMLQSLRVCQPMKYRIRYFVTNSLTFVPMLPGAGIQLCTVRTRTTCTGLFVCSCQKILFLRLSFSLSHTEAVCPSVILSSLFIPKLGWKETLACCPTSKATKALSVSSSPESVTRHIQLPKSSGRTSFNTMSQLVRPGSMRIRGSWRRNE